MRKKIIIDPNCRHPDVVRHDILTRAYFQSRGLVSFHETEDIDGRTILTIDFRNPLDADAFDHGSARLMDRATLIPTVTTQREMEWHTRPSRKSSPLSTKSVIPIWLPVLNAA